MAPIPLTGPSSTLKGKHPLPPSHSSSAAANADWAVDFAKFEHQHDALLDDPEMYKAFDAAFQKQSQHQGKVKTKK